MCKRSILAVCGFILSGVSLLTMTSCNHFDEVSEQEVKQAQLNTNFQKAFGEIDPNQDWNLVSQVSSNISLNLGTNQPARVKIYSANPMLYPENAVIIADFTTTDGATIKEKFDLANSLKSVYVQVTSGYYVESADVQVSGKSLNCAFTPNGASARAITRALSSPDIQKGDYIHLTMDEVNAANSAFVEGQSAEAQGLVRNYEMQVTSDEGMTFYPVIGQTSGVEEIGVYYYPDDNVDAITYQPVYNLCGGEKTNAMGGDNVCNLTIPENDMNGSYASDILLGYDMLHNSRWVHLDMTIDGSHSLTSGDWSGNSRSISWNYTNEPYYPFTFTANNNQKIEKFTSQLSYESNSQIKDRDVIILYPGKYTVTIPDDYLAIGARIQAYQFEGSGAKIKLISNDDTEDGITGTINSFWSGASDYTLHVKNPKRGGKLSFEVVPGTPNGEGITKLGAVIQLRQVYKNFYGLEKYYADYNFQNSLEENTNDILTTAIDHEEFIKSSNIDGMYVRPVTVKLPSNYKFGFYIIKRDNNDNGVTMTSNIALNTHQKTFKDGQQKYYSALNEKSEDEWYMGLEDWPGMSGGDFDCNDIIFVVKNAKPIVPPQIEENGYIVAWEDLGATDDFDFNDVVMKINHVAGSEEATLSILAAGGTLPIYIKGRNGNNITWTSGQGTNEEIHAAFGVETTTMVNTGIASSTEVPMATVKVGSDFTMVFGANTTLFTLVVIGNSGEQIAIESQDKQGEAPQVLVIPDTKWSWPRERKNIGEAFGGFSGWVNNKETNTEWYKTQQ